MEALDVEEEQEKAEGRHRGRGAAEQEGEAALPLDHLQGETTRAASRAATRCRSHFTQAAGWRAIVTTGKRALTDPKATCSSISPVLALVTRTVVAQPLRQRRGAGVDGQICR